MFDRSDFQILRNLGKGQNIVICSPDKGRGVVLLDRVDYIDKMMAILSDSTKILRMHCDDVLGLTVRLEDKINNFLIN